MIRVRLKSFILPIVVFTSLFNTANGQTASKYEVDFSADACELNSSYIDMLIAEAKEKNERIFIISRASKFERNIVNQFRLREVFDYLKVRRITPEKAVLATGERISNKNGRLEFYLGSQLFLISHAGRNKPVCLTCCPVLGEN